MIEIVANDAIVGATVHGIDAAKPISDTDWGTLLAALGRYGLLRFPDQQLEAAELKAFSERFGDIQGSITRAPKETTPEVNVLSNIKEDGQYIGAHDAGQDWHTDMSYRDVMGFVNVLYGLVIPRRDGRPLGGTEFSNMHAAYDDLPDAIKSKLDGMTATHDFNKFWDHMRHDKGSTRPALTAAQRALRPPSIHPIFLTHPITGRKVLYCNPGYAIRINELSGPDSDAMLGYLFDHQLQDKYRYTHVWTENDLLVWDNLGTIHRAIADYRPDEPRLIRRCQVMATKVFKPEFLAPAHQAMRAA